MNLKPATECRLYFNYYIFEIKNHRKIKRRIINFWNNKNKFIFYIDEQVDNCLLKIDELNDDIFINLNI